MDRKRAMGFTKYSRGQHSIKRYPIGKHGIWHPTSWYVRRTARRTAMPAFAALLSSSMTVGSLGVPVSAFADSLNEDAPLQIVLTQASEDRLESEAKQNTEPPAAASEQPASADNADNAKPEAPETPDSGKKQEAADSGKATPDSSKTDESKPDAGKTDGTKTDDGKVSPSQPDANKAEDATPNNGKASEDKTEGEKPSADAGKDDAAKQDDSAKQEGEQQPQEQVPEQPADAQEQVPEQPAVAETASPSSSSSSSYTSVIDDGSTLSATVTELKVASRLLDAGWSPEMIAAAVGNMYAESGSNASSFDDMSGMFNYSYEVAGGLFQWTDCGSSSGSLSSAGFTGLTEYAQMCGKDWRDPTLQTEYFLKTWRDEWMERQTYYDATSPEFANVDVSVAAFDECDTNDFDADGIVDSRDDDIDGDGIKNDQDPVTERVVGDQTIRYAGDSALHQALQKTPKKYSEEEARQHVAELTFAFMAGYEGPSARVSHLDRRVAHALRMYPAILALEDAHELDLSENAALVVASAATMLGGTYVWGAESPAEKTFDCSGLTKWCYSLVGVEVDHYSETQRVQADKNYAVAQAVPGDILWRPGHVGIYIGNGTTIEAKGTNYGIVYGDASGFNEALHFAVLDEQTSEENTWKQVQSKLKEQVQEIPSAIQFAADKTLK